MSLPDPASDEELHSPSNWFADSLATAFVAYWLLLFVATHVPIEPQIAVPGKDKTLHIVGYGILALLLGAVAQTHRSSWFKAVRYRPFPLMAALIPLALYAAFDELTQPLVGRHCDFNDWLADVGGIVIGLLIVACVSRAKSFTLPERGP